MDPWTPSRMGYCGQMYPLSSFAALLSSAVFCYVRVHGQLLVVLRLFRSHLSGVCAK